MFQVLENTRRDIKRGVVNNLIRVLNKGEHFETPLMANLKNDKYRLLDGNHRYEAIKAYLKEHKTRSVEVVIHYYTGLDECQEKEIYTKWNKGRKQSSDDIVKQYWEDIPVTKLIKKDFPIKVSAYGVDDSIKLKMLLLPYVSERRNKEDKFIGYRSYSAFSVVELFKEATQKDYNIIKQFIEEFVEVFGHPGKFNMYYKPLVFTTLACIWYDNAPTNTREKMLSAFHRVKNHSVVSYWERSNVSRETLILCHRDFLEAINGQRKKETLK